MYLVMVKLLCNFNILLQTLQQVNLKLVVSDIFLQIFIIKVVFTFTLMIKDLFI